MDNLDHEVPEPTELIARIVTELAMLGVALSDRHPEPSPPPEPAVPKLMLRRGNRQNSRAGPYGGARVDQVRRAAVGPDRFAAPGTPLGGRSLSHGSGMSDLIQSVGGKASEAPLYLDVTEWCTTPSGRCRRRVGPAPTQRGKSSST